MDTTAVLARIAEIQRGIPGIRAAFSADRVPENVETTPAFVNVFLIDEMEYEAAYGCRRTTVPVLMRLLVDRQVLPVATTTLTPFVELVLAAFERNVTLGGLVTMVTPTRGREGTASHGGTEFLTCDFRLEIRDHVPAVFEPGPSPGMGTAAEPEAEPEPETDGEFVPVPEPEIGESDAADPQEAP